MGSTGAGRKSRWKANALLVLVATLLALGLAEVVARLVLTDPIDRNLAGMIEGAADLPRLAPGGSWRTERGVEIHANALGFRSETPGEPIPAKSPDRIRVAVMGDSETFCASLPFRDCFGGQLERALAQGFPELAFEVLVFAIPGWTNDEQLAALDRYVLPTRPDVVVLNLCLNDIESTGRSTIDLRHWYDRSLLVRALRHAVFVRRVDAVRRQSEQQYVDWERGGHRDTVWAPYYEALYRSVLWEALLHSLLQMKSRVEQAGAAFVLTNSTEITAVDDFAWNHYPHRTALGVLRGVRERGILFVDPLAAFQRAGRPGRAYYVDPKDPHKNALGNRLLAEYVVGDEAFRAVVRSAATHEATGRAERAQEPLREGRVAAPRSRPAAVEARPPRPPLTHDVDAGGYASGRMAASSSRP